jgi:predicted nucleic acid-binding protein
LHRRKLLAPSALEAALVALVRFAAQRIEPRLLLRAIHELGPRFAPQDAAYVALARGLDAELVTCDGPLARACDGVAKVRLV